MVNGARGTVEAIVKTGSEVTLVLVRFDHSQVGSKAIAQSQYRNQHPEAVPISRHEAVFCIGKLKSQANLGGVGQLHSIDPEFCLSEVKSLVKIVSLPMQS